jgi:hypothetical protein
MRLKLALFFVLLYLSLPAQEKRKWTYGMAQPYFGVNMEVATGQSLVIQPQAYMGLKCSLFKRFIAIGNLSLNKAYQNDINSLDRILNWDLTALLNTFLYKTVDGGIGLALMGTYEAGNRPAGFSTDGSTESTVISNETGVKVILPENQHYFVGLQMPIYGAGIGCTIFSITENNRPLFLELSVRYTRTDVEAVSEISNPLSPYFINVPQQYTITGLGFKRSGLAFRMFLVCRPVGVFLDIGTRPNIYEFERGIDKMSAFQKGGFVKMGIHFTLI